VGATRSKGLFCEGCSSVAYRAPLAVMKACDWEDWTFCGARDRDPVQRRRTSTIVPTMAPNLFHEHEPKHPALSSGSSPHEGHLSICGLRPLSG
jgi:hypothetical protein